MTRFSILILSFGLIWIGCAGDQGTTDGSANVPGVTDSTITIGSWAPLSGPAAAWGAVGHGTDALFKIINDEGGIHGRKINFILKDDQYQPAKTVGAVKEMAERDRVFAFTVGVGTAPGQAVKNYIIQNNIPWVGPSSGSTAWAFPPQRNIFAVYPPYFDEAALLTNYAIDELGKSKIGIIYLNDDYGRSGLVGTQFALESKGLDLVEAVPVEVLDSDLTSQTIRLQESGAEIVMLWSTPKHAAIVVGTATKLGFQPQWMSSSTLGDARLMHTITEGLWGGTIFTTFGQFPTSDNPTIQKYMAAKQKYGADVQSEAFFLAGMLFAETLVEGLKQTGRDLTREKFITTMENLNGFQGTGGSITFGPGNRLGTRQFMLAQCNENGVAEALSDWMESGINLQAAIERLESGE